MNSKPRVYLGAFLALAASVASANVIVPTLVASQNLNSYSAGTPGKLTDNSGLSAPVPSGVTLASILGVTHVYDGNFQQSWVTNASGSDYFTGFGATNPPVFVWDLGDDYAVLNLVIWQYQNNGGGGLNNQGNHARTMDLRFNMAADGFASFAGPVTTLVLLPVEDNDGVPGNDLGGVNSAQVLSLTTLGRYVQVTVTDNYRNYQGITAGGDRVGLGEVRFDVGVIPEPATCTLLALGLASSALTRRRARRRRDALR